MFSLSAEGRRERQLSSDTRAGMWSAGNVRRRQRRFVRRNWRNLLTVFAIIVVPAMLAQPLVASGFQRGLLIGVSFTAAFAVLSYFVTQATGTGPAMMGATAEQWTASELRPLRKRGWRVVNHLALRKWDIDHVLVGPGGAWAVETKWSAQPWKLEPVEDRVRAALDQAQRNASDLCRWQPFKSAAIGSVQPLVILWGATADEARPDAPTARRIGGSLVLLGVEGCAQWRRRLLGAAEQVLTQEQVEAAWQAMDRHAAQRDEHDRAVAPIPPSMLRIYAPGRRSGQHRCRQLPAVRALVGMG
jgi:hypothetical protein